MLSTNFSLLMQKAWNHQAKPYERIDVTFCSAKIVEGNKSSKRYTFDLIHLTGKTYTLSTDRDSMMAWVSVIQVSLTLPPLPSNLMYFSRKHKRDLWGSGCGMGWKMMEARMQETRTCSGVETDLSLCSPYHRILYVLIVEDLVMNMPFMPFTHQHKKKKKLPQNRYGRPSILGSSSALLARVSIGA